MLPEYDPLINPEEETLSSLSSLEGMDPNSTLPAVGYRDLRPPEIEPGQVSPPPKLNRLRWLLLIIFISALAIALATYGLVARQRSSELNRHRTQLKINLVKLISSLEQIDADLTTLEMTGNSQELSLPERLTRQEKLSLDGKTEAIRATQTLAAIDATLNNALIKSLTPPAADAFNQAKTLALANGSFADEAYKTFAYLNLTYAADTTLRTLSLDLAEVINSALISSDVDPNQLKGMQTTLEKTKTTLTEAGKSLPFALSPVAEKNLALLEGFTTAVTAAKLAIITQNRSVLTTLVETTGAKLNTLWQARKKDEQAFWSTNRTLKRFFYLKADLTKTINLL